MRAIILMLIGCVLLFGCGGKKTSSGTNEGLCSYVVADSLSGWIRAKKLDTLKHNDTLSIYFTSTTANNLWDGQLASAAAITDLSKKCKFNWQQVSDAKYKMDVFFEKSDSTYCVPNNLILYLFK